MQDVLTLPAEKREIRKSVITSRTQKTTDQKSTQQSSQQRSRSVVHTNGSSPNGTAPHLSVKRIPTPMAIATFKLLQKTDW